MLLPKRTKFRKQQKGRIKGVQSKGITISFGDFGLASKESGRITSRQIEATRRAIVRKVKRSGKLWIRIFPDTPVTKKPAEVRMGKGKGAVDHWVCKVKENKVLFEISGVPIDLAKQAFKLASAKLPVSVKFIQKDDTRTN